MSDDPRTPRRGPAAVEAAIDEFELRERVDETDRAHPDAMLDLSWVRDRIDVVRRAADADIVTAEEALEWIAAVVGRELPDTLDEDRDRD